LLIYLFICVVLSHLLNASETAAAAAPTSLLNASSFKPGFGAPKLVGAAAAAAAAAAVSTVCGRPILCVRRHVL
jgi:hypothetical protein